MILGSVLNPINSSMLAVALIPIGRAFDAPPSQTAWLVAGLYLATAVGQPVVGRLVDAFGPRRPYLAGTALVGLAGLLGALAPHLWVLVVSRVLLGLGTSAAYPASMSLLRSESDRTGRQNPSAILATLSICNQTISVAGPALGGLLIGAGGWHWIFAINVPLSLACLVLGALRLPPAVRSAGLTTRTTRTDVVGMLLFAASLTAFVLILLHPAAARWYLPGLGLVIGAAFVRRELLTEGPFLELRVLRGNTPLLATYARQLLTYTASYSYLYGLSQWFQDGRGLSAPQAGLLVLPMSVTAIGVTALAGRSGRVRGKLVVGAIAQCVGCGSLLLLRDNSPLWLLVSVGVLLGLPQGLVGLANQTALYAQAEPARIGASAGLLRTFMYLGALLASAASALSFDDGATSAGLHTMAWPLLGVAGVFLLVCVGDRSLPKL
ncbi:MFS transporter [Streptomyces sp. NPDC046860]|uniref:MFS transporter n=1 Tax=Streptomyces sp. NPDC046860 TaxID=3154495 RepID=UPI00340931FF